MEKKYLILGAIPIEGKPETFGGTTVLMKSLLDFVEKEKYNYSFVQLNKYSGKLSAVRNYIYVLFVFFIKVYRNDIIILNVARKGAFLLSPVIFVFSKLFFKKVVFRIFGGNFQDLFENKYSYLKLLAKSTFLKSDLLVFETKQNINFLKSMGYENFFHLPNVRSKPNFEYLRTLHDYRRRFVFIGHVKKQKGILDIIEASRNLPDSFKIDIYGPIKEQEIISRVDKSSIVNYKGVLKPNNVIKTLAEYDVILLPSYHEGEGHPGILIEGMSIGLPAISTNWKAIPEVIKEGYNGLLIPVKNPKLLQKAMLEINDENYISFSKNALKKFDFFNDKNIYTNFFNHLNFL
ncbi:glycosyltransferase [Tamlana sp. 2201CG12-4]|uniref:glycosyltransferase n=1 Tax=Tamlana sp. 2201CG12-4 TaxID=3112582 RepID=UPI002DBBDD51|nr:glycosyltransferase [Tamlana sp. 2201CG12-4]MEC3906307.1 glycosyltransferase [Tamlana sp. 2201CG12-4]